MVEKYVKKSIIRFDQGYQEIMDDVVTEFVLTLCVNQQEFKQMICTPEHFEELGIGVLVSEGLITKYAEIASIDIKQNILFIQLVSYLQGKAINNTLEKNLLKEEKTSKVNNIRENPLIVYPTKENMKECFLSHKMKLAWCLKHMETLERRSTLFHMTGGVHSAALVQKEDFLMMYEDIGRHNAVDKVIGAAVMGGIALQDKALVLSGRVSSEIVMKVVRAQIPMIISKTAPTDLAIEIAKEAGIAIIGFVRGRRANIYTGKDRLL